MNLTMNLSSEQKNLLSKFRKLLGSNDWDLVNHGLELLKINASQDLWRVFAQGVRIWHSGDVGNPYSIIIEKDSEIYKRVKAPYRQIIALHALLQTNSLQNADSLYLGGCQYLDDLSFFENLENLEHLTISIRDSKIDISPLSHLKKLNFLSLEGLKELKDISAISELNELKTLWFGFCPSLKDPSPIEDLSNLEWLIIGFCHTLEYVPSFERLTKLKKLNIRNCANLSDYSALRNKNSLQELNLSGLNIGRSDFLSGAVDLTQLSIYQCQLDEINSISKNKSLKSLSIFSMGNLKDLSPLSDLHELEFLDLQECNLIDNLEPIFDLPKLSEICLSSKLINNVDQLIGLKNIKKLSLFRSAMNKDDLARLKRALPDCLIRI